MLFHSLRPYLIGSSMFQRFQFLPLAGSDFGLYLFVSRKGEICRKDAISKRRRIFHNAVYLAGMRLDEKWLERLSRFERAFYCHGIRKAELAAAGESKAYAR